MLPFLPPPRLFHHFSPALPVFPPLGATLPSPSFPFRVPLLRTSFMPPALLVTVEIPDEAPFRCADCTGGCDLVCLRCVGEVDICCVEDRVYLALGGDGECARDDEVDASATPSKPSSRGSGDSECFRFPSRVKEGGEGRDDRVTASPKGSSSTLFLNRGSARELGDLKPLSHCFLYNRKTAIVARASVTLLCSPPWMMMPSSCFTRTRNAGRRDLTTRCLYAKDWVSRICGDG